MLPVYTIFKFMILKLIKYFLWDFYILSEKSLVEIISAV